MERCRSKGRDGIDSRPGAQGLRACGHPSAFERQRHCLLREAGFSNVTFIGGSRDGGIDDTSVSLIGFALCFQAKRHANTLSCGVVRDSRGDMAGRGDQGPPITTGTFTADVCAEATRDGAPPVDLIDGQALTELLRECSRPGDACRHAHRP